VLSGILLAAGRSVRFGADKLLHPLPNGTPMALASLRNLRAVVADVVAVVGPDQVQVAALLEAGGARLRLCPGAERGMGASLACGVAAAANANGWIIALADMPFIRPASISAVARALGDGARMAAPFHAGRRGHPVGFGAELRGELLALDGDEGARSVVARHAQALQRVECDDPGVLHDVDVPADLGY
jgi:molybdenum cofactor cytidylyltransferase